MQRQLAIKIITIIVVALVLLIPLSMVSQKVYERQGYLEHAKSAVAQSWTGEQLIATPVLIIPYRILKVAPSGFYTNKAEPIISKETLQKRVVILPDNLNNKFEVGNKSVFKGIYEVPVYNADVLISGAFSADKIQGQLDEIKKQEQFERIGEPYLSLHISDMRGIDQTPELQLNNKVVILQPGTQLRGLDAGLRGAVPNLSALEQALTFTLKLSLRGMGSFSFISLADNASTSLRSDWPHPQFMGASLPKDREISDEGFSATWASSRYSNNGLTLMRQCLYEQQCEALIASSSGVSFIEPVDVYLQSERSIKYAVLFIGLSFITFFIFEHISQRKIHPIQYAFIGLAISVFYLLLISLAEHILFHWAYLISVICCSSLILFYVRYMLASVRAAILFSAMISGLYGLLYVIVQAEDFALLMGALLVFVVLAVLMVVTRHIDWYSLSGSAQELSDTSEEAVN